ncbi:P-loop containing nucleoside triphosphate hydrolase protein, partial [Jimgerdemannia flammicorona]
MNTPNEKNQSASTAIVNSTFRDNVHFDAQVKETIKATFYGVPDANHAFVDRLDILMDMETSLKNFSTGECKILALKGLGGIGKTQLMLHYCYIHSAEYECVFWLEVSNWAMAVDSFRKLAINLGFDEDITEEKDSEEKVIDWVRSWLQKKTKWLLLLDNADDVMAKEVFKLLPCMGGHIILTTREPIPSSEATVIHVGKMKAEEAITLLLGGDLVEPAKIRHAQEIVSELDCIPLAVDLARAYVHNTLISFRQYLHKLKTEYDTLLRYQHKDCSGQYDHTVATVWQISFQSIRTQNPTAMQILEICAFLQPDNIPVRLFEKQYSALQLVSTSLSANKEVVRQAIAVLVDFSFVIRTHKGIE